MIQPGPLRKSIRCLVCCCHTDIELVAVEITTCDITAQIIKVVADVAREVWIEVIGQSQAQEQEVVFLAVNQAAVKFGALVTNGSITRQMLGNLVSYRAIERSGFGILNKTSRAGLNDIGHAAVV